MNGRSGVTVAALPNDKLIELASNNVKSWLDYKNRGRDFGLKFGEQIRFSSGDIQSDWSKETPFDAIFVHTTEKSVVDKMKKLLKPGGRMICLEKRAGGQQVLYRIDCVQPGFYRQWTAIAIEDVSFAEGQQLKEPILLTPGKPTVETIDEPAKETISVPPKETISVPREETITVPKEETIPETSKDQVDVPPEATLDAYKEESIDEYYTEEASFEYG
ncbi:unnamed protein product [Trichobilharzia szidati]|nr:unnamed protein product [Trichobilharzia szidati]